MIKLKNILKENKKPINELVLASATLAMLYKFIKSWAKKNPDMVNKLKAMVKKL